MTVVRQEIVTLKGFTFTKDLCEDEALCQRCHGTGLLVKEYPFVILPEGSTGQRDYVWYDRRFVGACPDCYAGIRKICKHCGDPIQRGWLVHDCDAARTEQEAEEDRKLKELADNAEHLTEAQAAASGVEFVFSEGHGEYYSMDELSDLSPEDRVTVGICWVCANIGGISLDAGDIVDSACENLHEAARDNISRDDIRELQALLDSWAAKHQRYTQTFEARHKQIVVLEQAGGSV